MSNAEQERAEARIDKAKLLEWIDQRRVKASTKEAHDEVVRIERSIKRGTFDINSLDREEQLNGLYQNEIEVSKHHEREANENYQLLMKERERIEQLIAENERMKKELFQARNERWEYEKGMSETHGLLSSATQGLEWYANEIIWIQGRYEGGVFFSKAEDDKGDQARAVLKQINQS